MFLCLIEAQCWFALNRVSFYSKLSQTYNATLYEGCPSISWTFVITRDFVSRIL